MVVGRWSLVVGDKAFDDQTPTRIIRANRGLEAGLGIWRAVPTRMPIASIHDLQVFRASLESADAVSAILNRPEFIRDFNLRTQLASASASITAQIAEGYGQLTDRHFAHYLGIARGGCNEMHAHLAIAYGRGHLERSEWKDLSERYIALGKRITRLIQHLRQEDRRDRG